MDFLGGAAVWTGGGSMSVRMNETTMAVWRFIAKFQHEFGSAPTLAEIAEGCYLSTSGVERHLSYLEGAECIERFRRVSRGIKLLVEPPSVE